ncbi:MAG TPA: thiol oxidoreductase, partial [Gammaproteobacteria bacterium]|nr:thiol oxidoreductase [Gammaproteobacteria bacterium]
MRISLLVVFVSTHCLVACDGNGGSDAANHEPQIEHRSAGDATVVDVTSNAFSAHSANMSEVSRIQKFNLGNDFFQNPWVAGSASTSSRDGLGGLFNNNACQDCHIRDGRGHAPNVSATEDGTDFSSALIRATRSNISETDKNMMLQSLKANVPDSSAGGQLQHDAVAGVMKEVDLRVSYIDVEMQFADGHIETLRQPSWHITNNYVSQGHAGFDQDTVFSVRTAPPMIGLGLLALIPETAIIAQEDPNDMDGDGISGRANRVWSIEQQAVSLGRFGWKAGQPSLLEQSAGAFVNDMGLTSRLQPDENCMPHQVDCLATPNGNGDSVNSYDYEVSDAILDAVAFYAAHLAVPQRRDAYGAQVQRGKALFQDAGCDQCHVARYDTASSSAHPELSEQSIFPYTDLLLHDMGEQLADFTLDNQPVSDTVLVEFLANGREWRTPPLWGIGLTKAVDPHATFLHDGRARTVMEAVLWHG